MRTFFRSLLDDHPHLATIIIVLGSMVGLGVIIALSVATKGFFLFLLIIAGVLGFLYWMVYSIITGQW